jgi:hypothetical protein
MGYAAGRKYGESERRLDSWLVVYRIQGWWTFGRGSSARPSASLVRLASIHITCCDW